MSDLPWPALRASRVLEAVNAAGRALYEAGLRRPRRAQVPVVSVGNIACGGTGKTPTVAALAGALRGAGFHPAILTRGYRRRGRAQRVLRGPVEDWRTVGDEPALLAASLPDVPVIVDADRARGAATAVAEVGATHLVLDDGFQHWRLARDLDLVVVDADDPLAFRSPRREGPRALRRAHALLLAGATESSAENAAEQLRRIVPHTPIIAMRTVVRGVRFGGELLPPASLAGKRVVAVAGIAAPERFFATVAALGAEIVRKRPFADHHPFAHGEMEAILADAERAGLAVVATAKDVVKLPAAVAPRVLCVEIEFERWEGSFLDLLAPVLTPLG